MLPGEWTAPTQPFPVIPPPVARQTLTRDELTTRTPEAAASALATFEEYSVTHAWDPARHYRYYSLPWDGRRRRVGRTCFRSGDWPSLHELERAGMATQIGRA